MDIPADIPLGPPSQSKNGTGTLIVLFSPSPRSFYRVKEFTDLETAKKFCEACAAAPSVQFYLRLIICDAMWQDFSACTASFDNNRSKVQKYMVLWKDMEPNYHNMREFEKLEDAMQYASATRIRLQELKVSSPHFSHHCLPDTMRVVAFTLVGEWNVANKPAED